MLRIANEDLLCTASGLLLETTSKRTWNGVLGTRRKSRNACACQPSLNTWNKKQKRLGRAQLDLFPNEINQTTALHAVTFFSVTGLMHFDKLTALLAPLLLEM